VPAPSFVVAGTQKAATTWLYECLNEHGEVHVPAIKELHFFCDIKHCPKSRYGKGMDWYLGQFEAGAECTARGELSIDYMFYPEIARKLHAINPEMKILFILRDPIDRAYSAYWMHRRNHVDYPPFSDFLRRDSDIMARGLYYDQIQEFRKVFSDEQILTLVYEDIAKDPYAFTAKVFEFLGVEPSFRPKSALQLIAETKQLNPYLRLFVYRYAARILRFPPALWTWRLVKRVTGVKRSPSGAESGPKYPKMPEADKARLAEMFNDENEKLFDLIGRRIPEWQGSQKILRDNGNRSA
jgi:hypothetical protein